MRFLNNLYIFLLFCGVPVIVYTGCQTSQKLRAVESIAAVQTAVHNTMTGYADAVALGSVSLEDRIRVREAYRKYEVIEAQIVMGLQLGTDLDLHASPEELSEIAFQLTLLISTILD